MKPRRKPSDYTRMGALIAAIVLAKVLMPNAIGEEGGRQAGPILSQPAPIYVKTIKEVVTAPFSGTAHWFDI